MSAGPGPAGHDVVTGMGTVDDKSAVRPFFSSATSAVATTSATVIAADRRNLLRAAAAAPAVPLLTGTAAQATDHVERGSGQRFALAALPDTQYLFDAGSADPAPLRETFRYLLDQRDVVFMTHLGDVTEHGTAEEIGLAGDCFRRLDGRLPYSVLAGNHDVRSSTDDQRGDSAYLKAFGPHRFAKMPTFAGASADGYNSAHLLDAGGRRWLVLALDWRVSDRGLTWAQGILDKHPRVPAIVTTHDLAYADETGVAALSGNGQRLWDRLIKGNDQIFLTLNGHYWPPGRTVLRNDAGHDVHVHITNYQDRYYGGAGMVRTYTFDLARNTIDVETFAPWFLAKRPAARTPLEAETIELTGPADRFSLEIDFAARFAGFDPPSLPAPRPAAAVVGRHTAAYWRFDGAGQSVADGATVRDLTGGPQRRRRQTQRLVPARADVQPEPVPGALPAVRRLPGRPRRRPDVVEPRPAGGPLDARGGGERRPANDPLGRRLEDRPQPERGIARHRHPGPALRDRRDLLRPAVRPGLLWLARRRPGHRPGAGPTAVPPARRVTPS